MSTVENDHERIIRTQGLLSFQNPPRFRRGDLLIQSGKISAIGGIPAHPQAVIAESPYLVMPAFFQLRAALQESFLDRYFVATPSHENFRHIQVPHALANLSIEEKVLSINSGLQQLSLCGTSCASHLFSTLDEATRITNILSKHRLRGFLLLDLESSYPLSEIPRILEQVLALQEEHPGVLRVGLYFRFPRRKLTLTTKKAALLAYENNLPLYVETPDLSLGCIEKLLRNIDLRSKNISLLPLKLTGIDSAEVTQLLSDENIFVHVTPLFHLLMGESPPDLKAAVDANLSIAVSSLSGATRSQYNIFHELYHLRRWLSRHCDDAAVRALRMATLIPAQSAGFSSGKLSVEQSADLLAIDVRNTKSTDVSHLADLIIDGAETQVRSLWVRGEPIKISRTPMHGKHNEDTKVFSQLRAKLKLPSHGMNFWPFIMQLKIKRLFQRLLPGN
ncbi:MAG: hypothetical protein VYC39_05730 [Myxococcota bacterium]|nr:hypothetical protein [Myxococcota bacterium]